MGPTSDVATSLTVVLSILASGNTGVRGGGRAGASGDRLPCPDL